MYGYNNDDENDDMYGENNDDNSLMFLSPIEMQYMKSLDGMSRIQYMTVLRLLTTTDKRMLPKRDAVLRSMNIDPSTYKVSMSRKKLNLVEKYYRYTFFDPETGILN